MFAYINEIQIVAGIVNRLYRTSWLFSPRFSSLASCNRPRRHVESSSASRSTRVVADWTRDLHYPSHAERSSSTSSIILAKGGSTAASSTKKPGSARIDRPIKDETLNENLLAGRWRARHLYLIYGP